MRAKAGSFPRPAFIGRTGNYFRLPPTPASESFTWLPNVASGFAAVFTCFGFRISFVLRFCPFAIAKGPFKKCRTAARRSLSDQLDIVLTGHPLVALVVIADAVLG